MWFGGWDQAGVMGRDLPQAKEEGPGPAGRRPQPAGGSGEGAGRGQEICQGLVTPPLREEDRKEGGFYSALKSYALPRTWCTNLARYLNLCNQSALARQSLGLNLTHLLLIENVHH